MKWVLAIIMTLLAMFLSGCAMHVKPGELKVCMIAGYVPDVEGSDGKIEITLADNVMDLAHSALGALLPWRQEEPAKPPEE